ncbi:glycosyltransferase family 2 protein [bacterium]|nr:glycosyltransferase family 2 protein [bacterium]
MGKLINVAVILPALNEEKSLGSVLDELRRMEAGRLIVADNGSTDRTADVARSAGADVVFAPRRGYGSACLAGISALKDDRRDESIVVFIDADGSSDPAELPALIAPIEQGDADLVIGSRNLGRVEPGAMSFPARVGNWLAPFLIRLIWGFRYTDLGPFRAIRADALRRLGMRDPGYGWTVEMQIKAVQRGLKIVEVPVTWRNRQSGVSKISRTVRGVVGASCKIVWTIFRYAFVRA